VLAQVQDVGDPYGKFYLGSYAMPIMHTHASLTSALQESRPEEERVKQRRQEAEFALLNAWAVLLMVIHSQDALFSLGLEAEIEACEREWVEVWGPPRP
jgi:hypothetical protein